MTSISQQKADSRQTVYQEIRVYLEENPNKSVTMAMCGVWMLGEMMTLKELQQWFANMKEKK